MNHSRVPILMFRFKINQRLFIRPPVFLTHLLDYSRWLPITIRTDIVTLIFVCGFRVRDYLVSGYLSIVGVNNWSGLFDGRR